MTDIHVNLEESQPINVSLGEAVNFFVSDVPGEKGDKGDTGETGSPGQDGASGVVQSIVAGENVTVDNTDPANPVVAVAGGGGGGDGFALIQRYDFTENTLLSFDVSIPVTIPAEVNELKIRWYFIGQTSVPVSFCMATNDNFAFAYASEYYQGSSYISVSGQVMRLGGGAVGRSYGEAYGIIREDGFHPAFKFSMGGVTSNNAATVNTQGTAKQNSLTRITKLNITSSTNGTASTVMAGSYFEVYAK